MKDFLVKNKLFIGVGIAVGVLAITYINRVRLKKFVAEDLGKLSEVARKIVWDSTTESNIKKLHPAMQPKVRELINKAEQQGIKLRIPLSGGMRTFQEQTDTYNQGRTTAGDIVTNAKAGESYHNYGLGVDVVEVSPMYGYAKDYPASRWDKIAEIGKSIGLEWGGNWSGLKDKPHFQLNKGTVQQLLALYNSRKVDSNGFILV